MEVKVKFADREVNVTVNAGESLQEAVDLTNESVVYNYYLRAVKVAAGSVIRAMITAEKNAEEIQKSMLEWKPGVQSRVRKSMLEKFLALSPEKRAAALEELTKHLSDDAIEDDDED